jgi:cyclic-di-GMP-binding protein
MATSIAAAVVAGPCRKPRLRATAPCRLARAAERCRAAGGRRTSGRQRRTPLRCRSRVHHPVPYHAMPSFDVVSEVDKHELTNAIDQAQRELGNRFDFRNVDARFELDESVVSMRAPSEFQLQQMRDILDARLIARKIDTRCIEAGEVETNVAGARQQLTIKQGIEQKIAKKIIAAIKDAKLKVEAQINGEKLRVSGKKRDDLQLAIALLRKGDFELPLQFDNFRD